MRRLQENIQRRCGKRRSNRVEQGGHREIHAQPLAERVLGLHGDIGIARMCRFNKIRPQENG